MCNKTTNSKTKQVIPSYLEQVYKGLLNAGKAAASQPLKQYNGPRVAGFTPMQDQAFTLTQQAQGMGVPYLNAASQALSQASSDVFPSLQGGLAAGSRGVFPGIQGQLGAASEAVYPGISGRVNAASLGVYPGVSGMIDAGAQGAYGQVDKYNAGNLQQYMDPYMQQVIDTAMANIHQSDAIAQQQLRGSGIGYGVSPGLGDRMGLAQAEMERNQGMNRNQTIAGLLSAGFQNAQNQLLGQQQLQAGTITSDLARQLQAAGLSADTMTSDLARMLQSAGLQAGTEATDRDRILQAAGLQASTEAADRARILQATGMQADTMQSDLARKLQVASGMAGIGQQAQDQALQGANALLQQGGMQQQLGQTQLDQAYQKFQEQQNYPKSQIEWLANLAYGSPHGATTTQQQPAPSWLSQLAGLATTGLGAYKAGVFGSRGGAVPHYDDGGSVDAPQIDYDGWIPPPLEPSIISPIMTQTQWDINPKAQIGWPGIVPQKFGYHPTSQRAMYINALPQLNIKKSTVTRMPGGILNMLREIPHFSLKPKDLEANKKSGGGGIAQMGARMAPGGYVPDFDEANEDPLDITPSAPSPGVAAMAVPKRNWGIPMMMAGLGMMSSNSPYPLQGIGEGALKGLSAALELDQNPVVDDSGPTIRVYYPSERRWEDTGIPSTKYAALQVKQKLMSQRPQYLNEAELTQAGIGQDAIAKYGHPYWDITETGQTPKFPMATSGVNIDLSGNKFNEKLAEYSAKDLNEYITAGNKAQSITQNLEVLQALNNVAPQAPIPRYLIAKFPEFSKVSTAFEAVKQGMIPDYRVPGMGGQSDMEYAGIMNRIGQLQNDPNGNRIVWEVSKAKAEIDMARRDAVMDYQMSEGTPDDKKILWGKLRDLNSRSILTPEAKRLIQGSPPDQISKRGNRTDALQRLRSKIQEIQSDAAMSDEDKALAIKREKSLFDEAAHQIGAADVGLAAMGGQ